MEHTKNRLQSRFSEFEPQGLSTTEKLQQQIPEIGRRVKKALVLLDPKDQSFIYGIPPDMRPAPELFLALLDQPGALSIHTGRAIFSGPHKPDS